MRESTNPRSFCRVNRHSASAPWMFRAAVNCNKENVVLSSKTFVTTQELRFCRERKSRGEPVRVISEGNPQSKVTFGDELSLCSVSASVITPDGQSAGALDDLNVVFAFTKVLLFLLWLQFYSKSFLVLWRLDMLKFSQLQWKPRWLWLPERAPVHVLLTYLSSRLAVLTNSPN